MEVKIMLKKGDKVKVRNNLEVWKLYNDIPFIPQMQELKGKQVTISKVEVNDYFERCYLIKEDNEMAYWSEEMFEPIKENPMPKLESGMFIKNVFGHYGVITGEKIIYHSGGYDILSRAIARDGFIKQVIENNCGFGNLSNGKIIWEYKERKEEKPVTYLEDFMKKHPDCTKTNDNLPYICAGLCYGFNPCPKNTPCKYCWNAPKGTWK